MVIHDFHAIGVAVLPFETDTPSVVDANAILPHSISAQFFKSIRRWNAQIIQGYSTVEHTQFAQGDLLNIMR